MFTQKISYLVTDILWTELRQQEFCGNLPIFALNQNVDHILPYPLSDILKRNTVIFFLNMGGKESLKNEKISNIIFRTWITCLLCGINSLLKTLKRFKIQKKKKRITDNQFGFS